jgi:hypothetical protein
MDNQAIEQEHSKRHTRLLTPIFPKHSHQQALDEATATIRPKSSRVYDGLVHLQLSNSKVHLPFEFRILWAGSSFSLLPP